MKALAIIFFMALPVALSAGEIDDIQAVEREIAAENEAMEIVKRARERAIKAVQASSLGVEYAGLKNALQAARAEFESSDAYTLYKSEETKKWLDPLSCLEDRCSDEEQAQRWAEVDRRIDAYFAAQEQFERETEEIRFAKERIYDQLDRLVDLMTDVFIEDEVDKAIELDLRELERSLRRIWAHKNGHSA